MFSFSKPYSIEELKEKIEIYQEYVEYFSDPVFVTHREWDGIDFYQSVKALLDDAKKYISQKELYLGHKGSSLQRVPDILEVYDCCLSVVLLGLQGKRSSAYKLFEEKIASRLIGHFFSFRDQPGDPRFDRDGKTNAYRIRSHSDNPIYSREELFHIPFELNHLIANNRFSLSGFPCLYMSNSVYGAWEELNRPDIDECFVSRLDLSKLSFVDLSQTPSEITQRLKNHLIFLNKQEKPTPEELVETFEYYLVDYLYLWPLILCSSFKVQNDSVFKPEYIFPQIIMEWLVSAEPSYVDGVKFLSTKSLALDDHIERSAEALAKNYVIPARQYNRSGFCSEYVDKIALTTPINYSLSADSSYTAPKYADTVFSKIEDVLENKELKNIEL